MAEPSFGAGERARYHGEPAQVAVHRLEVPDALGDVSRMLFDEVCDMGAGSLTAVAKREDLPDLAEREPDRLGRPNEAQALDGTMAVVTVAARRSLRLGENPNLLVIADRLRGKARFVRQLADTHGSMIPA